MLTAERVDVLKSMTSVTTFAPKLVATELNISAFAKLRSVFPYPYSPVPILFFDSSSVRALLTLAPSGRVAHVSTVLPRENDVLTEARSK